MRKHQLMKMYSEMQTNLQESYIRAQALGIDDPDAAFLDTINLSIS